MRFRIGGAERKELVVRVCWGVQVLCPLWGSRLMLLFCTTPSPHVLSLSTLHRGGHFNHLVSSNVPNGEKHLLSVCFFILVVFKRTHQNVREGPDVAISVVSTGFEPAAHCSLCMLFACCCGLCFASFWQFVQTDSARTENALF